MYLPCTGRTKKNIVGFRLGPVDMPFVMVWPLRFELGVARLVTSLRFTRFWGFSNREEKERGKIRVHT